MFSEQLVLSDEVSLQMRFCSPQDYRLACVKDGRVLVEFDPGRRYEFKSVEKLRYDFERAVAGALRQD